MKKLLVFIFLLGLSKGYCNNRQVYKYYVYLTNSDLAPSFIKSNNGNLICNGTISEQQFYNKYEILKFEKVITVWDTEYYKCFYYLETYTPQLVIDLQKYYSKVYRKFEDVTYDKIELSGYPNDYGVTNPNIGQNTGPSINRSDLDYINVAKAWNITDNLNSNVKIGISDAKINVNNPDFSNNTTFVNPGYYQNLPYDPSVDPGINTWHGTAVAGIAAAKGNNGYASTGVCKNCDIISTGYGNYQNLILLAQNGVKVINMSWVTTSYVEGHQNILDSIVNFHKVVLVAAAGNEDSFNTNEDFGCKAFWSDAQNKYIPYPYLLGKQVRYPASYNNVISVSSISHKNAISLPLLNTNSGFLANNGTYDVFLGMEDSYSSQVGNQDPNNPMALIYDAWPQYRNSPNGIPSLISPLGHVNNHTVNEFVDILAPAYDTFRHDVFIEQGLIQNTGNATSGAAPIVTGSIALMFMVNDCLLPSEVDNILKLTTKNTDKILLNRNYGNLGWFGAGKLETGDAVEFVNEMKKADGNALIDGQDFWRFNFDLQHINNNLTISNQTFRDKNISNFIAKNEIRILPGTSIKPDSTGSFHLGINPNINVTCNPSPVSRTGTFEKNYNNEVLAKLDSEILLYPNPNSGDFKLENLNFERFASNNIEVKVTDLNGRILLTNTIHKSDVKFYEFNLEKKFNAGIYLLNLSSDSFQKTIKFIIK